MCSYVTKQCTIDTSHMAVMAYGWEGKRRSCITEFSHVSICLQAQCLSMEN